MSAVLSLSDLPSVANARLPVVYETASRALAACSSIDECQEWADKAQAMASYARQAKDETLRKMADRIQARAIRRCGELLRQVPTANGARTDVEPQDGIDPRLTRTSVADAAGLSERQRKTALRVAAVPETDFVAQVESESPPTVTALAKQGTAQKPQPLVDLGGVAPQDYARATQFMGGLRTLADYCAANDARRIAAAVQPHEIAGVRRQVAQIEAWLDVFMVNVGEK
jgi:hypothetical protein